MGTGGVDEFSRNIPGGYSSSDSMSGSYSQGFTPPPLTKHGVSPPPGGLQGRSVVQQQIQHGVDYDQAGIDFVLTYRDPSQAYMSPPPQ
jgi:hypothetical protein